MKNDAGHLSWGEGALDARGIAGEEGWRALYVMLKFVFSSRHTMVRVGQHRNARCLPAIVPPLLRLP